jgi:methionyl-tRNA formyltransferase
VLRHDRANALCERNTRDPLENDSPETGGKRNKPRNDPLSWCLSGFFGMNPNVRLIFMGTPAFGLAALSRLVADGHEIAAVFTQPDKPAGRGRHLHQSPVKLFALEHGIPVHQPAKIKSNDEVRKVFLEIAPDACVVAAYGKILPEWMLRIPRFGCINVHASLLPKYRGAAPVNWAIANGETATGVSIMLMDVGMDTGSVFTQRVIDINPEETAPELSERLAALGAELLSSTLPMIETGALSPVRQNDQAATYAPMLKREHGLIGPNLTAREIANHVRAFQPWPGSFTTFRGQRLIIWRAAAAGTGNERLLNGQPVSSQSLTFIGVEGASMLLRCAGPSVLRVEEVQIEGRRRVSARDFVNGMRLKVGDAVSDPE